MVFTGLRTRYKNKFGANCCKMFSGMLFTLQHVAVLWSLLDFLTWNIQLFIFFVVLFFQKNVLCRLPWLNSEARGEHLTKQLSWAADSLLVTRVCLVYLVDEFILCVLWSRMIGLMLLLLKLSWIVSMVSILWGVDGILWNGYGI